MDKWPLGVFTSLDAGLGVKLDVARELGVPTIHLHAPEQRNRTAAAASEFLAKLETAQITISAVFAGFAGESYADIPTVSRTVGLVPPETRAARVQELKEISDFTRLIGCDVVGMHIGFVPERGSPNYQGLIATTQNLLDHVAGNGQRMHLETGQETADHLLEFIGDVGRKNLFINFDPANMILYGTGDPIAALKQVGHLVRSIHCKDATWAAEDVRGKEWGREVALGQGDVGMATYLETLKEIGYDGPLTIEREIPQDPVRQKADIGQAVDLLNRLKKEIA